jgi:hypothetical protein
MTIAHVERLCTLTSAGVPLRWLVTEAMWSKQVHEQRSLSAPKHGCCAQRSPATRCCSGLAGAHYSAGDVPLNAKYAAGSGASSEVSVSRQGLELTVLPQQLCNQVATQLPRKPCFDGAGRHSCSPPDSWSKCPDMEEHTSLCDSL